ncbi:MAG: serine/threonine-protein kinase [Planctomycetota bacterium]
MNAELQEGQVLLDRFVLRRRVPAGTPSPLWSADDRRLGARVVLRILATAASDPEAIRRDVRAYRLVRHPAVARVDDVLEVEDGLVMPIEPGEGELLSARLGHTGPMPFRALVDAVRPLADGLQQLHERGVEHGRIDPDHVLVETDGSWVLLPGDPAQPARGDLEQLGRLIAVLLTGDNLPPAGRPINDHAERLHEGRTVPALLDQLVTDLAARDPSLWPSGVRGVLNRLEQIDRFLEPDAPAAAAPVPPPAAVPPPAHAVPPATSASGATAAPAARPVGDARGVRLRWLAVPVVVLGGASLFHPAVQERLRPVPDGGPPAVADADAGDASPTPPTGDDGAAGGQPASTEPAPGPSPEEQARIAEARRDADDALGGYLAARRGADQIGAAEWAAEPYGTAAGRAAEADRAFLEERYAEATDGYAEAADGLRQVVASAVEALPRLLQDGRDALDAGDSERATAAFRAAGLIDPGNRDAAVGLERAATLDELSRLLASGREHEDEGRLAFAVADYAAATELDLRSEQAATAYRRVRGLIADEQFQAMMSAGLEAYHRADYDQARARLAAAEAMRPGSREVAQALEMVHEAELRAEVGRLREQAITHELGEQWQEAWNAYRQVLAIDDAIEFARAGKQRSELMIRLEKRTNHYLANPELLIERGTREDAVELVDELRSTPDKGPRLREAAGQLAERVRLANTPLRVTLTSDGATAVDVYRVGRYGSFETVELELLPGVYTIVGHRTGYKDVRLTLRLEPGETGATVAVVCTERI